MWTCPNCLTGNVGETCSNCGTRRPGDAASVAPGGYHRVLTRPEIKERAKASLSAQRSNAVLNWLLPTVVFVGLIALIGSINGGFSLLPMLNSLIESGSAEDAFYTALDVAGRLIGTSVVVTVLTALINFVAIPVVNCAQCYNALRLYRGEKMQIADLIIGFKQNFFHVWGGSLWRALFLFLWGLIPVAGPFIVAIKTYAYAMTPYILIARPGVDAREALKLSIKMTMGHKMELFVLDLSFIGWNLLNYLTFGILGILFVDPYAGIAHAGYFDELETAFHGGRVGLVTAPDGHEPAWVRPAKTWTCPTCGRICEGTVCPSCGPRHGGESGGGGLKGVGPVAPPTHPTKFWRCPNCGCINNDAFCTGCGMMHSELPIDRPGTDPEPPRASWTCACGRINYDMYCTKCGRSRDDRSGGTSGGGLKINMGSREETMPASVDPAFRKPGDL